jgi:hypothetical protein
MEWKQTGSNNWILVDENYKELVLLRANSTPPTRWRIELLEDEYIWTNTDIYFDSVETAKNTVKEVFS